MSEVTCIRVVVESTADGERVSRSTFMLRETWERDPEDARQHLCRIIDELIVQVDRDASCLRGLHLAHASADDPA